MQAITPLQVLKQALQAAQAAWTGCDWDTEFGPARVNLRGLCSRQAKLAAQATRGEESSHWREACQFLDTVEHDARMAADLASKAVDAWSLGNIAEAIRRLEAAIELEARYREPVAYPSLRELMQPPTPSRAD